MNIVIIGSGNVATAMGNKIRDAGHIIQQIFSRRETSAARLASELGSPYTTHLEDLDQDAALYMIAVTDTALEDLCKKLLLPDRLVVHTAGALATEALLPVSAHCGVLYPLQSLRRDSRPFPQIPLLVDTRLPEDLSRLMTFARTISSNVMAADSQQRLKMHVAGVIVNNFTNHLYALAADFCQQQGLDFSLLQPIITETAERLRHITPAAAQTGPAIRGDDHTIEKHLEILSKYKNITELYKLFTLQLERLRR